MKIINVKSPIKIITSGDDPAGVYAGMNEPPVMPGQLAYGQVGVGKKVFKLYGAYEDSGGFHVEEFAYGGGGVAGGGEVVDLGNISHGDGFSDVDLTLVVYGGLANLFGSVTFVDVSPHIDTTLSYVVKSAAYSLEWLAPAPDYRYPSLSVLLDKGIPDSVMIGAKRTVSNKEAAIRFVIEPPALTSAGVFEFFAVLALQSIY